MFLKNNNAPYSSSSVITTGNSIIIVVTVSTGGSQYRSLVNHITAARRSLPVLALHDNIEVQRNAPYEDLE